jgi:signal recognition particle subunit SEC65
MEYVPIVEDGFYPSYDLSYSEFRKKVAKSRAVGSFALEELKTYMNKLDYTTKYPNYCKRLENDYPIYREDFLKRNHLPEVNFKETIGESLSKIPHGNCSLKHVFEYTFKNGFLTGYLYGVFTTLLTISLWFAYVQYIF